MGISTRDCPPEKALTKVAGLLTVADVRIPHQNLYRPSIPMIARDGFCPMAKRMTRLSEAGDPDQLGVRVWIDGQLIHVTSTADRLRNAAQLVAALSQTMTLQEGDLVLMGVSQGAPRVRPGQHASITIDGLEPLHNVFVTEKAGA
jgi:5-oxopent-3-ene-1,2,5-tricarboxylate decarboxylase/2-hydroxyhepta-2,4-diene-1,7-dioate isomerase